jgi:ATP-dependent RNA helicase DDX31/DBP7
VLLCTDVAARGLDFPAVSTIIQYDPAGEPAEYVHRVGRTARMGQQGEALLFLLPSELPYVQLLQQHGMQLAQEKAGDLLRTLPALLARTGHGQHSAGAGRAGGSGGGSGLLRLARKLQQESRQAGTEAAAAAAAGGNSGLSAQRAEQMAAALLLQRQLLAAVAADAQLRQMALDAFRCAAGHFLVACGVLHMPGRGLLLLWPDASMRAP